MQRVALEPCFVLHGRPFRETSQLVELLSRHHGRLGVLARGSRRPGRRGGPLQPFQPLLVSWAGRGELPTVTAVEADGLPCILRGGNIAAALYLNELVMRLLHRGDPHPDIYAAYRRALAYLVQAVEPEAGLRVFEKRLLEALGYGLVLDRDAADGTPVEPGAAYRYEPDQGPVRVVAAAPAGAVPVVSGRTLVALDHETLDDDHALQEAKRLMRFLINVHLDGRPLRSRQLFRSGR